MEYDRVEALPTGAFKTLGTKVWVLRLRALKQVEGTHQDIHRKGRWAAMANIILNPERQSYVLDHCPGYTCFGFANVRNHVTQMAERLKRPELAFGEADFSAPTD